MLPFAFMSTKKILGDHPLNGTVPNLVMELSRREKQRNGTQPQNCLQIPCAAAELPTTVAIACTAWHPLALPRWLPNDLRVAESVPHFSSHGWCHQNIAFLLASFFSQSTWFIFLRNCRPEWHSDHKLVHAENNPALRSWLFVIADSFLHKIETFTSSAGWLQASSSD